LSILAHKPSPRGSQALESEAVFRLLVESVRDYAIFILNPQGIVASWNMGAERIKGYKASEIIGQHFSKFYPAEDIARGKPAWELKVALETGSYEDEGWRLRKDGSRFWANVVISRILDHDGNLIGFGKVTRDLTERREAEQQYRRLIEGVSDYAIYSLDKGGHITSWNVGARRLKGYESEEVLGWHFSKFYVAEDVAKGLPERVLEIALADGHYEGEGWRVRKDGSRFWSSVLVTPIRNEDKELIGFSKITRDITDRKILLDKIQQHAQDLETKVKEQEEMNAELEAFSYSVSHDLRAPLRAIEGFSDIILQDFRDKIPGEAKEFLGQIVASTARMNRLVRDLLDYSRIATLELEATPVNVWAAIFDALNQLEPELRPDVSVAVEPNLQVKGHQAIVRQVISNLINNAVKFAQPGKKPVVEVRAFRRGDSVGIQVQDHGIGIAQQHQERVFKVFERLHDSDEYPGTGIGLAIVRRGVSRMGGTIKLRSELGKGSIFEISLPAA